jgi:hypothetical protein
VQWNSSPAMYRVQEAFGSVRRQVFITEFCIPMKPVRIITTCLNETCSEVHIFKNVFDMYPIQNSLKRGGALAPFLFNFDL